jgi:hypothetical protein
MVSSRSWLIVGALVPSFQLGTGVHSPLRRRLLWRPASWCLCAVCSSGHDQPRDPACPAGTPEPWSDGFPWTSMLLPHQTELSLLINASVVATFVVAVTAFIGVVASRRRTEVSETANPRPALAGSPRYAHGGSCPSRHRPTSRSPSATHSGHCPFEKNVHRSAKWRGSHSGIRRSAFSSGDCWRTPATYG